MNEIKGLVNFLDQSVTSFQTVEAIKGELDQLGFIELKESKTWKLKKGGNYYTTRNQSSIIAFSIGSKLKEFNFNMVASHSDVPAFKLKPNYKMTKENFVQLNTEFYGSPIYSTWFDRLLSVAGRVIVKEGDKIVSKLIDFEKPCGIIPNVAIHLNRETNSGFKYNEQTDLLPFVALDKDFDFMKHITKSIKIKLEDIIDFDLYLYPVEKAKVWGSENEFISSFHLDDAQCAYTTLKGFLKGVHPNTIGIYCCFDNEEIGSSTRQGAAGTFLTDVLERVQSALAISDKEMQRALASSLMVSADNAHAYHPNHPEKLDATNAVHINQGVVIKYSARQSYATDAMSAALFKSICVSCGVNVQLSANRSDIRGGSTLGSISVCSVGIPTVDIGLPQLAMHSTYETAGTKDTMMMIKIMEEFFNSQIIHNEEEEYEIRRSK